MLDFISSEEDLISGECRVGNAYHLRWSKQSQLGESGIYVQPKKLHFHLADSAQVLRLWTQLKVSSSRTHNKKMPFSSLGCISNSRSISKVGIFVCVNNDFP